MWHCDGDACGDGGRRSKRRDRCLRRQVRSAACLRRCVPAALLARRCAPGVPGGVGRGRQGGQGLVTPAHGRLNPCLNGWGFRGRPLKIAPRNASGPRSAARHDQDANARDVPIRSVPSPCPPCRCFFVFFWDGGVSRPIEGLDSLGAVRTLRMARPRAGSADASRPRVGKEMQMCAAKSTGPQQCWQARSGPVCAPSRSPQREDGAVAVEALDVPRHAMYPINKCRQRQDGQGLGSMAVAPRRWASSARIRRFRARSVSVARTSFIERPRKSRPFRPDFRWPHAGEPSPCPACRKRSRPPGRQARSAWQSAPQASRATSTRLPGRHAQHRTMYALQLKLPDDTLASRLNACNRPIGDSRSLDRDATKPSSIPGSSAQPRLRPRHAAAVKAMRKGLPF